MTNQEIFMANTRMWLAFKNEKNLRLIEETGISSSHYYKLFDGRVELTLPTMERIASYFGLTVVQMLSTNVSIDDVYGVKTK